ncbi:hypothetical protein PENSPDRAFT_693829 [Peniophora sp. CONT]|nr:hypothetical protein PENSPDRAFT_693829 [Peniophora sp. CONT]
MSEAPNVFELAPHGDLIVLGRGVAVKIDSYFLTSESAVIADAYATARMEGEDITVVHLPEHVPDNALLCVLALYYPSTMHHLTLTTAYEWALAFILACAWDLTSVRDLALASLNLMVKCPVERAVAGAVLGLQEWVSSGMEDLMSEVEPLGLSSSDMDSILQNKARWLWEKLWQ